MLCHFDRSDADIHVVRKAPDFAQFEDLVDASSRRDTSGDVTVIPCLYVEMALFPSSCWSYESPQPFGFFPFFFLGISSDAARVDDKSVVSNI